MNAKSLTLAATLFALAAAGCAAEVNEAETSAMSECLTLVNNGDYFPGLTQSLEGCQHGVHIAAIAARRDTSGFVDASRIERIRLGLQRKCGRDGAASGDPEFATSCEQGVGLFEETYARILRRPQFHRGVNYGSPVEYIDSPRPGQRR